MYIPLDSPPYVSSDGGQSWALSRGAPNGTTGSRSHWEGCECKRWACDRARAECYIFSSEHGANGTGTGVLSVLGADGTWSNSSAQLPPSSDGVGYLASNFARGGEFCVCLGANGLWCVGAHIMWLGEVDLRRRALHRCSTDAGATAAPVPGISECRLVDWGAAAPGEASNTSMFVFGKTEASQPDEALFVRLGGAWLRANDPGTTAPHF